MTIDRSITIDFELHERQRRIWNDPARFRVVAAGRRFGKSWLGCAMCFDVALHGGRAWWVAPSYPMSNVGWRGLAQIRAQLPGVGIDLRRGERSFAFPGGGEVRVKSADNPDSLRGEGLDFVVLDECAFISEEAWTDALRPALSDRLGKALFISTPAGRNWFWRLWMRGQDLRQDEWRSWRFPTSGNPFIKATEIEAARQGLPERTFAQEYLAEFMEDAGDVFRNISACLYAGGDTPEQHSGHRIVMGVDWGKHADFTALSVVCADCKRELALDLFNQIDYAFQRQRLAALAEKWHVTYISAESNAMGEPVIEQLQRDGLPVVGFQTTAQSKPPLIESLALAFEKGEVRWLDDATARLELESYERKVNPTTGRSSYSAPEGLHDDTVMARALSHRAITVGRVRAAVSYQG